MFSFFFFIFFAFNGCRTQKISNGNYEIPDPYGAPSKCEIFQTDHCKGLLYNTTIFPNHFGHLSQKDAGKEMDQYTPLIKILCSSSLKLFFCSLLFPPCTVVGAISPCNSLCLENKMGCEPIMKRFGFSWPESMACEKFPENDLCIKDKSLRSPNSDSDDENSPVVNRQESFNSEEKNFQCPTFFDVVSNFNYSIRIGDAIIPNCGIPCNEWFFSDPESRVFSRAWLGGWAGLCLISCLITLFSFLIDLDRFQYPQRPVMFLALCYSMTAGCHLAGALFPDKIACTRPPMNGNLLDGAPLLIAQGTRSELCVAIFMLAYASQLAAAVWFAVLALCWFLAACRGWAHEAIAAHAQYFHFAAWALPAANCIALLAWGRIGGDPLSGLCVVSDPWAIRLFIIGPLSACLLLAGIFLVAGYAAMFHIRAIVRTEGAPTHKLEQLIVRLGLFAVVYLIPALVLIGCHTYESSYQFDWNKTWYQTRICSNPKYRQSIGQSCRRLRSVNNSPLYTQTTDSVTNSKSVSLVKHLEPEFELSMLKHLMALVVGPGTLVWVCGFKTLRVWRNKICSCFGCSNKNSHYQKDGNPQNGRLLQQQHPIPLSQPIQTNCHILANSNSPMVILDPL